MTIYHTVYQTTNKINDYIYIGVHTTDDPNDRYLGSGPALKTAINEHGKEHFTKRPLSYHNTRDEAFAEEANIVTEEFVKRIDTYNMQTGGGRGLPSEETKMKQSKLAKQRKKIKCQHCKGYYSPGNHGQHHGDRCPVKTGIPHKRPTATARARMSRAQLQVLKKTCPHCKMIYSPGPYKQHHGDKCSIKTGIQCAPLPLEQKTCEYCKKITSIGNYVKYHGNKCPVKTGVLYKNSPRSLEARAKQSKMAKNRTKKECPHCGIKMDPGNYKQHHGPNCKKLIP